MTTDSNDSTDPGSEQQALVKRLARTATAGLESDDKSLKDTVSSQSDTVAGQPGKKARHQAGPQDAAWLEALSDTVADRVAARTRDVSGVQDRASLEATVSEVTRELVAEKAARLEFVLKQGLSAPETVGAREPISDEVFDAAKRRLARCCRIAQQGLQSDEFFLFKRHLLQDATWQQLAVEFPVFHESSEPDEDVIRRRLELALDELRSRVALDAPLDEPGSPAADAATEAVPTASESDDLELEETLLTWGLTERQQYLASRSLPWVALRAVNGTPPDLPLREPLLVNAANSDAFLEWAKDAEFSGTPAEPVVIMLEDHHDSLPARFWSYSHGTVSPNDWTRAEDLLACNRLLESESAALSVELQEIPEDADTLMWRIAQFAFDSEVTAELQAHLAECVTCRVAFNAFLEKRLAVWRANVAYMAPAFAAATVSEPATVSSAAEEAAEGDSLTAAPGVIRLPDELAGKEWLEAVPVEVRQEWSLAILAGGFLGLDRFRGLLAELQRSDEARPEGLFYTLARMISELKRRAIRPSAFDPALTSYSAETAVEPSDLDPAFGEEPAGGPSRGVPSDTLVQFAMGDLGRGELAGPSDAHDLDATKEQFRTALTDGFPAEIDGWSFTVELDPATQELVLHTMKDVSGAEVRFFEAAWQQGEATVFRKSTDAGELRLALSELVLLSLLDDGILRIQRA